MPQIIDLDPAILTAAKEILAAESGWSEISRKASESQSTRLKLEAQLFHDPSPKAVAELVAFDVERKTIGDLQQRIVSGQLDPRRLIGERVKSLLAAPLRLAIANLEADLAASIQADSDLAEEHGMTSTAGPRTRSVSERLAVAQNTLQQAEDGTSNPLKIFAKLGYALSDAVDAEAMSNAALKSVRDVQHALAKSAA